MSCDFECQKDIYLENKRKTFNKKLEEYYSQYSKYLRELQELSKRDDPHQAMQEKRRRYEGKLLSLENQIKSILSGVQNEISGIESTVKKNKIDIDVNNRDITNLKRQLIMQERKIKEKSAELESKRRQLSVGSYSNNYRRFILYLLIVFNILLVVGIIYFWRSSSVTNEE